MGNAEFAVVGRAYYGNRLVGYVLQNMHSPVANTGVVAINQAVALAYQKRISNARVRMSNGKPVLTGLNFDLRTLQKVTVDQRVATMLSR